MERIVPPGLLSWGLNFSNLCPPHFHLTEPGKRARANLTTPSGFSRADKSSRAVLLSEALDCYVAGSFKAASVMTGAAAESIILNLRDATVRKLTSLGHPSPKGIDRWQVLCK